MLFAELQDFLLNMPRSVIISANKEGPISLLGKIPDIDIVQTVVVGYLLIHLIGFSLSTVIHPSKLSLFRKQKAILMDGKKYEDTDLDLTISKQPTKITSELCAYTLV